MPTPAYTDFDSNVPAGADSAADYAVDDLANQRALRDMVITGRVKGFVQSRTTGTGPDATRPQYITWMNSSLAIGFRMKSTWGGTGNYQQTSVEWEWSNDTGGSWTSMGTAQANTFDASDNITASTNSGGFITLVMELWTKVLRGVASLASHTAATGTSVHGLGSMSTQAASGVAVTGGSINGTTVGLTTPAAVRATRVAEAFTDLGSIADAGTATMDLSLGSHFAMTPSSTTSHTMTVAVSNPPASGQSQGFIFEIINGRRSADAKITWPAAFKWVGGSATRPLDTALELSGRNLFSAVVRDGGTTYDVQHLGKRG